MKIRMRLKNDIDLAGNPPARIVRVREDGLRAGVLRVGRRILRCRTRKQQERGQAEPQRKRWTNVEQWKNVPEWS